MNGIIIFIVILALIILIGENKNIRSKRPKKNKKSKKNNYNSSFYKPNFNPPGNTSQQINNETDTQSEGLDTLTWYPYQKKYLLTKAEYAFYRILKQKCDERALLICPKVRLEDFIQVTTKEQQLKYRGHIKSRHVDFLVCDSKLNILFAIELDDNSHKNEKAQKVDIFKNNLFNTIQIPLHRVLMSNGAYETTIDNILLIHSGQRTTVQQ